MNCAAEKIPKSPLDSKEIKPVNLKEINPEYSLEGLMLKLKLQYFGHLIRMKRGPGLGSFSRADRGIEGVGDVAPPTWLVSIFLVRPASSLGAPGKPGS